MFAERFSCNTSSVRLSHWGKVTLYLLRDSAGALSSVKPEIKIAHICWEIQLLHHWVWLAIEDKFTSCLLRHSAAASLSLVACRDQIALCLLRDSAAASLSSVKSSRLDCPYVCWKFSCCMLGLVKPWRYPVCLGISCRITSLVNHRDEEYLVLEIQLQRHWVG